MRQAPVTIALCLHLALAASAAAEQIVHGSLESLNAEVGVITLLLPPKHEPKQYNLARPDLPVTNALGQPLKLATLQEKQRLALTLDDAEDVTAIRLDVNVLWAYVIKVDARQRQLDVKYGHVQRTLKLPEKATVLRDGENIKLDELKTGQGIKAVFTPDQETLLQIQSGKGITGVSPYHRWFLENGIVLKVDHEKNRFQIVTPRERVEHLDFEFQPQAILRLMHSSYLLRTTNIDALQPYCKVSFYCETDTRKVVHVTAQVPYIVRRRVEAINQETRQLTIPDDDKKLTLRIADDAMIRSPKGLIALNNVQPEKLVTCGLTLDRREIVYVYLWD